MSKAVVNKFLSKKMTKATDINRKAKEQELAKLKAEEAADVGSEAPKPKEPYVQKDYGEGNPVGNFFGAIDDAYMGAGRWMLGLPKEGSLPKYKEAQGLEKHWTDTPRDIGGFLFGARPGAKDVNPSYRMTDTGPGDRAAFIGNRALHAGGITAAGAGLYELGGAIAGQFGGPADGQTSQQIRM